MELQKCLNISFVSSLVLYQDWQSKMLETFFCTMVYWQLKHWRFVFFFWVTKEIHNICLHTRQLSLVAFSGLNAIVNPEHMRIFTVESQTRIYRIGCAWPTHSHIRSICSLQAYQNHVGHEFLSWYYKR